MQIVIEIIPKSDTGSWRLTDLSAPNGTSVKLSMMGLIGELVPCLT